MTTVERICDYVTLVERAHGRMSIGPCGQPASRAFRVAPETNELRTGGAVRVIDRSGRTISWRCAKHSPLSRRCVRYFRVSFESASGTVLNVEAVA